jgi:hypothetical protein
MPRWSPRTWILAVLIALGLLWLPLTLQDDIAGARADLRVSAGDRSYARGPLATAGSDLPLVRAALARMPRHASFALVRAGRWGTDGHPNPRESFVWEAGASWTQFTLAPRVEVSRNRAAWLLVRDARPSELGIIRNLHEWRFGDDWLVQLR